MSYFRHLRDGTLREHGVCDGSRLTLLPSVETGLLVSSFVSSQSFFLYLANHDCCNLIVSPMNMYGQRTGRHLDRMHFLNETYKYIDIFCFLFLVDSCNPQRELKDLLLVAAGKPNGKSLHSCRAFLNVGYSSHMFHGDSFSFFFFLMSLNCRRQLKLEKRIFVIADEEPAGMPTTSYGSRILFYWRNR